MSDILELKRALAGRAQSVAEHLLPHGRRQGAEWRAGSVDGEAGKSLGVHLTGDKAEVWADFAGDGAGNGGGDLLDLWMAARKVDLPAALDEARRWLGLERPRSYAAPKADWKRPPRPACRTPEGRAFL